MITRREGRRVIFITAIGHPYDSANYASEPGSD
jgi:hypothetical protein